MVCLKKFTLKKKKKKRERERKRMILDLNTKIQVAEANEKVELIHGSCVSNRT